MTYVPTESALHSFEATAIEMTRGHTPSLGKGSTCRGGRRSGDGDQTHAGEGPLGVGPLVAASPARSTGPMNVSARVGATNASSVQSASARRVDTRGLRAADPPRVATLSRPFR